MGNSARAQFFFSQPYRKSVPNACGHILLEFYDATKSENQEKDFWVYSEPRAGL